MKTRNFLLITVICLSALPVFGGDYYEEDRHGFSIGNGIIHGKLIGVGFAGRIGFGDEGIIGIGYDCGTGIGPEESNLVNLIYWHWSLGIKFYPYKGLFISGHYGTVSADFVKGSIDNSTGKWSMEGYRKYYGPSVMIGADLHPRSWERSSINIGMGGSYISEIEKFVLAWNFSIRF